MEKTIWLDMDGTIAELYEVTDWLPKLRAENPEPYIVAQPKIDTQELASILYKLKMQGYIIGIISWLSMQASPEYKKQVRKAKNEWLKNHIPFVFDKVHIVQYGTPKHTVPSIRGGILVDDNQDIRKQWRKYGGYTIDAEPKNWLEELRNYAK